jgi:hypothetical protein
MDLRCLIAGIVAAVLFCVLAPASWAAGVGEFESAGDVGKVEHKGSAEFDAAKKEYKITGSGENMWKNEDAFQFVSKKMSGDFTFTMEVAFVGESAEKHRKACAVVRQSLDADAPYVDIAVHGDGMIGLQYRTEKGGSTADTKSTVANPATVKVEREGNVFTASIAKKGETTFQPIGTVTVALTDPVYVGLAVCSHNAKTSETAIFSNVEVKGKGK